MKTLQQKRKATYHTIRDYCVLALSMIVGAIGLYLFLQPNQIAMGGIVGIAQIVNWGTGVPVYYTYFALNFLLFLVALKILGWRFCAKTIFAVVVFTVASKILVIFLPPDLHLLADQKFMACMIGGIFMGVSVGLGLSSGGSTGGSDVVAAIVHKYRDVSLGKVILLCDMLIITSSYVVLRDWEKVLYSYVLLFIIAQCVDYVVNLQRQSVLFFIISDHYQEIGEAINKIAERGCSTLHGEGFYSKKNIKVVFCIAKKSESAFIFDLIDNIDPNAFVAQSAAIGVYGQGFDRMRSSKKMTLDDINKKLEKSIPHET